MSGPEPVVESAAQLVPDVLVVAALPEELAPLARRLEGGGWRPARGFSADVRLGLMGGRHVALALAGDGRRRATAAIGRLLAKWPARHLLGVGVATGLSPELAPLEVVVSRELRLLGSECLRPSDPGWGERLGGSRGRRAGTLVELDRVLVAPAEKAEAWRESGAADRTAGDLESGAWARAAAAAGIPWLVVRAVSDGADESLPMDFNRCLGADGGIRRARVALRALLRPTLLPALWRFERRVREAAERAAVAAIAALEALG